MMFTNEEMDFLKKFAQSEKDKEKAKKQKSCNSKIPNTNETDKLSETESECLVSEKVAVEDPKKLTVEDIMNTEPNEHGYKVITDMEISDLTFSKLYIERIYFVRCKITNVEFEGCMFADSGFDECICKNVCSIRCLFLSNPFKHNSTLEGCEFYSCGGVSIAYTSIGNTKFYDTHIRNIEGSKSHLISRNICKAVLLATMRYQMVSNETIYDRKSLIGLFETVRFMDGHQSNIIDWDAILKHGGPSIGWALFSLLKFLDPKCIPPWINSPLYDNQDKKYEQKVNEKIQKRKEETMKFFGGGREFGMMHPAMMHPAMFGCGCPAVMGEEFGDYEQDDVQTNKQINDQSHEIRLVVSKNLVGNKHIRVTIDEDN